MATETQALVDVVGVLKDPIKEDAEEPTFNNPPLDESQIASIAQTVIQTSENSKQPIKDQFCAAVECASQLPKNACFETFNDLHQEYAASLFNVFCQIPLKDLKCALEYAKKMVNSSLFNYALSVALLHRDDAIKINLQLPSHAVVNPAMYFDMSKITNDIVNRVYKQAPDTEGKSENKPVYVETTPDFTANNRDPEHKVAYFREDVGLNLHHRHWHEVYPFKGSDTVIKKNRRGELFYYMHEQVVARYNFERLCNGLPRVKPFADFREPIEEAYFPKLDSLAQSSEFPNRPKNAMLQDLHRDDYYVKLLFLERWRDRIYDAIDKGYAYTMVEKTNEEQPNKKPTKEEPKKETTKELVLKKIDPVTGIDELACTVEAVEILSWNFKYYGNLHNRGHFFIAYVHDPDYRYKEKGGVMSHTETALRDPIFYRWHAFIDEIFQHYKRTLPPYTVKERQFEKIEIGSVTIRPQEIKNQTPENENVLRTFWQKDSVDVTQGLLNNITKKQVYAVFTHLQHEEFEYVIKVNNKRSETVTGTVRIFIAPKTDESGIRMNFNGQRRMFIEMDKFTHELAPGENTITRKSNESSVTIPFEKSFMTFPDVKKIANDTKLGEDFLKATFGYCGCGWPQHLLVGKGSPGNGFKCDLFVMITDYKEDKVDESPLAQKCCDKSSLSYCGVRNKEYPDKKPMGFPFDRDITEVKADIFDFMSENQKPLMKDNNKSNNGERCKPQINDHRTDRLPNMIVVNVRVVHKEDEVICSKSLKETGYDDYRFQNENKTSA